MRKKRIVYKKTLFFRKLGITFLLLFLFLGIGYSAINTNLGIFGDISLFKASWNVYFDNINVTTGSVNPISAPKIFNKTSFDFEVKLENPGDYYEFTVDLHNDGTINARIGEVNISPILTSVQQEYLTYDITYDNGSDIFPTDLLLAGKTRTILVHVSFKDAVDDTLIPEDGVTILGQVDVPCKQATAHLNDKICTYDGELEDGVTYTNGRYTYTYDATSLGWSMSLTDKDSTDPVTTKMCTKINGKPIINMSGTFSNSKATEIDLSSFDTSEVVDMSGMFYNTVVDHLDLSTFDTSKVRNMASMFGSMSNMKGLDVSDFNTSNVTTFSGMFGGASSLEKLNLNKFNFSNISSSNLLSNMFGGTNTALKKLSLDNAVFGTTLSAAFVAYNLEEISLKNIDTSNVTDMSYMFSGDTKLTSLDLSDFDTSNVTNMSRMFNLVSKIETLDLSNFNTSNVTDFSYMFCDASNLKELNLNNFNFEKYSSSLFPSMFNSTNSALKKVSFDNAKFGTSLNGAFQAKNLEEISLKNVDTSDVTSMDALFNGDTKLTSLDLSDFDTSNVTTFGGMLSNTSSLEELDMSNWNFTKANSDSLSSTMGVTSSLKKWNLSNAIFGASMKRAFSYIPVIELNLTGVNTSNVTDMYGAFQGTEVGELDLSSFDLTNVESMGYMFYDTKNLERVDFGSKLTPSLLSMDNMFTSSKKLKYVHMENFGSSSLYNLNDMFYASTVEEIHMKNFNFGLFNNNGYTNPFKDLSYLKILDLSGANMSSCTNTDRYFSGLPNLEVLNLSGVRTGVITNTSQMFNGDSKLTEIDLSGFTFDTSSNHNTGNMFSNVTATVGYAKDQAMADWLNSIDKPVGLTFVVKP